MCSPVFFDKEGDHRYFTLCEKIIQEQISEFNQQLGFIHELRCIITDEDGNTEVKVRLSTWIQKLIMGINCRHLTEEWDNSL